MQGGREGEVRSRSCQSEVEDWDMHICVTIVGENCDLRTSALWIIVIVASVIRSSILLCMLELIKRHCVCVVTCMIYGTNHCISYQLFSATHYPHTCCLVLPMTWLL